jgi:hypothetical protein
VKRLAVAAGALLAVALAFGALTLYALEGQEVVVVRTHAPDGSLRETRTWIADDGGAMWIEAAFAERPFYQQILADPAVEIVRGGVVRRGRAVPVPNPDGHRRIRALLAQKYGWADWWVGWLQDTSGSMAVRIEPE